MRVLHVANYFRGLHSHLGGAENALFRTVRMLQEQGIQNALATLRSDLPRPQSEYPHYFLRRVEDFLPRRMARYMEPVKWYRWQTDPLVAADFRRVLAQVRPDTVHFHNFQFLGLDLIRLAKESGARICYTVYDYWMFCPNVMLLTGRDETCRRFHGPHCLDCLPPEWRSVQRMLLKNRKLVFDRYLRMVDRWVVLSEHSRSVLEDYGIPPDRIRVVRLTLPLEFEATPPGAAVPPVPGRMFFAGWLQKRKGLHVLLRAMPELRAAVPGAHLRVAGAETKFDAEYRADLKKYIRANGLEDCVTFLGHLPPEAIQRELLAASAVVIPEQFENMSPLLMIEGMMLGRPVVISRIGGIPEYVEDGKTGWLFPPTDAAALAGKLIPVLKGQVDLAGVARAARRKIEETCDSRRIARESLAVYDFEEPRETQAKQRERT